MSLNFSEDDEIYEEQVEAKNSESNNLNYDNGKNYFNDENFDNYGEEEHNYMKESEEVEEKKKKRKQSMTFQLKNLFNDVALNKINSYIRKKKRKSEQRNSYSSNFNSQGDDEHGQEMGDGYDEDADSEEDELQKYVREEKNKIKQILPEKDELWDIYMYLNLKKKKRKINYNLKNYTAAIKKLLECVHNEYKNIISEKLFGNKIFVQYLIINDSSEFFKNSSVEYIGKNMSIPIIKKSNTLFEIKKKLINLYNKGNCCNYLKEIDIPAGEEKEETNVYEQYGSRKYDKYLTNNYSDNNNNNGSSDNVGNGNDNYGNNDDNGNFERANLDYGNNINTSRSSISGKKAQDNTSFIIEKEKLNIEISKLTEKYSKMIYRIKQHKRKDLRTSFNLFMNLINEVTSKLYFSVHNVLLMEDNSANLADIYKTIRRKYNIHDVLAKVQKLTQKKEIYEHYRSYLLYKYKTTYPVCEEVFKNHEMRDNINIFNFKKFYNTEFSNDKFSIIREDEVAPTREEEQEGKLHDGGVMHNEKDKKTRAEAAEDIFTNDVYDNEDFFSINVQKGENSSGNKETDSKVYNTSNNNSDSNNNNNNKNNNNNSASTNDDHKANTGENDIVEETPLERAKRIAREKKKKLMESRTKII
ncbi:uncharacterized protein MKS88_000007 [Plasmodium brasilianum]|uniref:Uncharacterized protein n=1 Tax=Plasmodium malariae TaxID=5858 RepID=A0A1A8VRX6_PLAMA|nr:conserved Plasmodium protein, unknown function [Plasmodium malariae]KAI4841471.1 hypothetical protein MKS88_000007 [Plasmodium brasilianum]SBS83223.1 conserved Plasmodium protein, unknown function [Plasmodium malariae]SBT86641.1 conserved Plasmodium protein, unknown function [Plasmodium malariae]